MLGQKTVQYPIPVITSADVIRDRSISPASARVYLARQSKAGRVIRLKNNVYITSDNWDNATWVNQMQMANRIQVPSYISLLTALAYFEVTTQMPAQQIESIARTRTYSKTIQDVGFTFTKVKPKYFNGFTRINELFIATPEKALADAVYLSSFGKYALDLSAIDRRQIDDKSFKGILKSYPDRTQKWWRRHESV